MRSARVVRWGVAVVVGASALALTCTLTRLSAGAAEVSAPPSPDEVRTTYLRDCATCHGSEGRGTNRGPSIVGVGRAGVSIPPPAFPQMTDAQIKDIAAFIRNRQQEAIDRGSYSLKNVNTGDPAKGEAYFAAHCAACHSWAGEGGALLHREAPTLRQSTATQIAEAVRVGPGGMPAFGSAALDDRQLATVVAYVRSLRHPRDRGGLSLWHLGPLPEGAVAWIIGIGLLVLATQWIGERNPRA